MGTITVQLKPAAQTVAAATAAAAASSSSSTRAPTARLRLPWTTLRGPLRLLPRSTAPHLTRSSALLHLATGPATPPISIRRI
jgi:hypothetical protein